jgi:hypothetical protein
MPPVASWPTSWYRPRFVKAGYHAVVGASDRNKPGDLPAWGPRVKHALVLLFIGGCFFDADYSSGHYTCTDGVCPSGLVCVERQCVMERKDAAVIDTMSVVDAKPHAATCADPQPFPSTGGMTGGTTVGRANNMTSMCAGAIQNGLDAVYDIGPTTGPILVSVTGSFAVTAYAVSTCTATTACVSNTTAVPENPLSIPAGTYWIVVDSVNPAASGTYTLTLEVQ